MFRFSTAIAAAAAFWFAATAATYASTITFETASPGGGFTGPMSENGFTYKISSGGLFVNTFGNAGHDMEGQQIRGGGTLTIAAVGGGTFTFDGLDFAAYSASDMRSQTLTVVGQRDGSIVGMDHFTLTSTSIFDPAYANWTAETASALAGMNINELDIILKPASANDPDFFSMAVDNVALTFVAPAPEPSTPAILLAGLFGLVWLQRRRLHSIGQ